MYCNLFNQSVTARNLGCFPLLTPALVFYHCCNKVPQIYWLESEKFSLYVFVAMELFSISTEMVYTHTSAGDKTVQD